MAQIKILSEVAGTMWKVLVAVGDTVRADETVALVESMKMEIPVIASDDGTVAEIFVVPGDSIAEGQAVLTLQG